VSDLRGVLLFLPLTHVGSITRRNVIFGDSEILDSVVTMKEK
jgi:hypothetical protein